MTAKDLSGAFSWTSEEEARRIREGSDIKQSYGELRAAWIREERRKRKARKDYFALVFCLLGLLCIGIAMFAAARGA